MLILATISDMKRLALVMNLASGETSVMPVRAEFMDPTIRGRAQCRPFGITWNASELYIVNNRQLLVFDKNFTFLRISPTRLQVNTHQLCYNNQRVWAASPWINSLVGVPENASGSAVEFDIRKQVIHDYDSGEGSEEEDIYHFNSLLWAEGSLFVAAHGRGGPSFINQYDAETFRLLSVRDEDVGGHIHGLACHEGELFWLSTATNEIRSDAGYCRPLSRSGYARGFAVTSRYFVVAISEYLKRGLRHCGDSWIQLIDRQNDQLISELLLKDAGSVNDLRILDEYDFAHCVSPFNTPAG